MKSNFIYVFLIALFFSEALSAQALTDDFFRNTGKINTVLAVVLILFTVLILFLIRMDLRLKKLEKHQKDE
jgi:uncharacterized membrane protein